SNSRTTRSFHPFSKFSSLAGNFSLRYRSSGDGASWPHVCCDVPKRPAERNAITLRCRAICFTAFAPYPTLLGNTGIAQTAGRRQRRFYRRFVLHARQRCRVPVPVSLDASANSRESSSYPQEKRAVKSIRWHSVIIVITETTSRKKRYSTVFDMHKLLGH